MGDLIIFPMEERKMKRGILASMWWTWVIATQGLCHDAWVRRIGNEANKICHFHS